MVREDVAHRLYYADLASFLHLCSEKVRQDMDDQVIQRHVLETLALLDMIRQANTRPTNTSGARAVVSANNASIDSVNACRGSFAAWCDGLRAPPTPLSNNLVLYILIATSKSS